MNESQITTDHEKIKQWIMDRGGRPTHVKGTGTGDDPGILRIDFPEDENLEEISWDDFFEKFDDNNLAFLYQDTTVDGKMSRFSKFIHRE